MLKKFKMTNETYDFIKWLVVIVSPALIVLLTGLGELYGFETTVLTGTIALVTAFVGTILQISTKNYNKEDK